MASLGVVEVEVSTQRRARPIDAIVSAQEYFLVFNTLHKNVIDSATLAIHADLEVFALESAGEILARKLAPVIHIEDLRGAVLF